MRPLEMADGNDTFGVRGWLAKPLEPRRYSVTRSGSSSPA